MPGPLTTQDLLDQVRAQIDEANQDSITDPDILQALNRGQRRAANIIVKHCKDLLIKSRQVTMTAGTFPIPEDAYGWRVDHVTVMKGSVEYPLRRVTFRDLYKYSSSSTVSVPSVYALKGRDVVVAPTATSGVVLNVWYCAAPETLVIPQGRVTAVNVAGSYVLVDALGADLSTDATDLSAFVNLVDAQTGEIKVSLQTASLDTQNKAVTFKTAGLTLATVYNRTIATAIPTTVEENDYVCAIQGTCVPDLPDACLDYLIEYAVNECRRRLSEPVQDEQAMLEKLEQDVERQWAGREASRRISNRSSAWTR